MAGGKAASQVKSIAAVARVKVSADGRGVVSHAGHRGVGRYVSGAVDVCPWRAVRRSGCGGGRRGGLHRRCRTTLRPRLPPPDWDLPLTVLQRLENGEANVAARVGYSVAIGEHLAAARIGSAHGWRSWATRPAEGAVVADRRAGDRHHIRRGAARTVRAARAVAAGIAARRQRHRGLGGLRRGAGGGDGTTVVITAKSGRLASPKG
jgi:hypothetical protein